jgi:hypothetical protein
VSPEASFVFQGTVVAVGAATLSMVDADDRTAVVRVDRVLRAPEAMEGVAGREITVRLRSPAKQGTQATFQAEGWLYGESMAVVETGRRRRAGGETEARSGDDARESAAAADRAARFRRELKERAGEAAAVVLGRVTGVNERAAPAEGRLSEHDPQWAVATIEVDQAVKGRPARTTKVWFATSEDVMWRQAPKLRVGQQAVMLLQKGAPEVPDKRAHAVLDRLDVQPAGRADLVAELL